MTIQWLTAFFDIPASSFESGCAFWSAVTGYRRSDARGATGEFATLVPDTGDAYLRVQRVTTGVPGVHLDLHSDDVDSLTASAVGLGGSIVDQRGGISVMSSPGGLAFCIVAWPGEAIRPVPQLWPDGTRSCVDQVCVDIPPRHWASETGFWADLTGWPAHQGSRPEFVVLTRAPGMPIRLLMQRLDDDQAVHVTAHFDLACDPVDAERARHHDLGALTETAMPNWTTMVDPSGMPYCLTRRHPDTGLLA